MILAGSGPDQCFLYFSFYFYFCPQRSWAWDEGLAPFAVVPDRGPRFSSRYRQEDDHKAVPRFILYTFCYAILFLGGNRASGLDFGRILIEKTSKSALRPAGEPNLRLSRLECCRDPAWKPDFRPGSIMVYQVFEQVKVGGRTQGSPPPPPHPFHSL